MPKNKETSEVRRKYEFIKAIHGKHSVRLMCRLLGVAPSGYYAWLKREPSDRQREEERLRVEVRAIHNGSHQRFGSPRVHRQLRANGQRVGKKRVERIMREEGLKARPKRRFRKATNGSSGVD